MNSPQIILIGFKNTGKSSIGIRLAQKMERKFIDLDDEMINENQSKQIKKHTKQKKR